MRPQSAKNKGRLLQNWLRDLILTYFRELDKDDVRSTSSGVTGEDIQLSPAARKFLPFQFECKSKKSISAYGFYDQALSHGDHEPIVVIKQNGRDSLSIIKTDTLIKILRENYDLNASSQK